MFRMKTMVALVASMAMASATGYSNTIVTSDSGSMNITVAGTSGGVDITTSRMTFSQINKVRPSSPVPTTSLTPIHLIGTAASSTGTTTQTIKDGNDTITITLTLNAQTIHSSSPAPSGSDFLVITGKVTGISESITGGGPSTAKYDWTHLVNTSVTATTSGNNFSRAFGHTDVTTNASATFTQTNEVPEPSSLGLALFGGIGVVVNAIRRRNSK